MYMYDKSGMVQVPFFATAWPIQFATLDWWDDERGLMTAGFTIRLSKQFSSLVAQVYG